jgi:hypothetical protein
MKSCPGIERGVLLSSKTTERPSAAMPQRRSINISQYSNLMAKYVARPWGERGILSLVEMGEIYWQIQLPASPKTTILSLA